MYDNVTLLLLQLQHSLNEHAEIQQEKEILLRHAQRLSHLDKRLFCGTGVAEFVRRQSLRLAVMESS
jgi:hypothetical protein